MGRKSNAAEKRERIIWALYRRLSVKSYEKVTIKGIAEEAGLPSGVIHYYFESKDAIVIGLAEAIVSKYSNLLESMVSEAKTSEERIERIIDLMMELIFDHALNRVFYNLIQMTFERKDLRFVIRNMFKNYRERLAHILEKAGGGAESPFIGAALVAVTEGFSVQLLVDEKAIARSDVRNLLSAAVRDRLNQSVSSD